MHSISQSPGANDDDQATLPFSVILSIIQLMLQDRSFIPVKGRILDHHIDDTAGG